MHSTYFTAGPSQLYPSYQKHLVDAMDKQLGSVNHRSETFRAIYRHTDEQLRILLDIPSTHGIFFAASATEIWERILLNCVAEHSFHLTNGAFSKKFYDIALALNKNAIDFQVEDGKGFDLQQIHIPKETELICTTQNETSTGVMIPDQDLKLIKKTHPNTMLCCDLVSIAPYSKIDYTLMDSSFFSVQKAFGMPPGLGVWIANEQCLNKALQLQASGKNIGGHHTLASYWTNYRKFETPCTPNVMAIYILGKIAEDMNHLGVDTIRAEIDAKASMIYHFAEQAKNFTPFVQLPEHRSQTVAVLQTKIPSADIINTLKTKQVCVSSGYGIHKANQIRIANFPATNLSDMGHLLEILTDIDHA
jgi:phosphoserine aminotransferase